MKSKGFLEKLGAVVACAALVMTLAACSHNAATTGQDYGQVRTEEKVVQTTPPPADQVVGTVTAPANAQGATQKSTPAIISGPAKVDDSGRAYTSSSVGSAGTSSGTGTNTNVNIIPEKTPAATVAVTEVPAPAAAAPVVVVETPAPALAPAPTPVVVETVTETTVPMTSATTQEQTTTTRTTTHRRLRKD
jgi:hypothetical protein